MFQVSADIKFLDGTLAGLTIPSGFRVSTPSRASAERTMLWAARVLVADDFVRAAGTGCRFVFASQPRLDLLAA